MEVSERFPVSLFSAYFPDYWLHPYLLTICLEGFQAFSVFVRSYEPRVQCLDRRPEPQPSGCEAAMAKFPSGAKKHLLYRFGHFEDPGDHDVEVPQVFINCQCCVISHP